VIDDGTVIAQGAPEVLKAQVGGATLDDVFLTLTDKELAA